MEDVLLEEENRVVQVVPSGGEPPDANTSSQTEVGVFLSLLMRSFPFHRIWLIS